MLNQTRNIASSKLTHRYRTQRRFKGGPTDRQTSIADNKRRWRPLLSTARQSILHHLAIIMNNIGHRVELVSIVQYVHVQCRQMPIVIGDDSGNVGPATTANQEVSDPQAEPISLRPRRFFGDRQLPARVRTGACPMTAAKTAAASANAKRLDGEPSVIADGYRAAVAGAGVKMVRRLKGQLI